MSHRSEWQRLWNRWFELPREERLRAVEWLQTWEPKYKLLANCITTLEALHSGESRESGGSVPAAAGVDGAEPRGFDPSPFGKPPPLNKSGGWPGMCVCGHHAGKHNPEGIGPCGSVAHVDGPSCAAFRAVNKSGGSDVCPLCNGPLRLRPYEGEAVPRLWCPSCGGSDVDYYQLGTDRDGPEPEDE